MNEPSSDNSHTRALEVVGFAGSLRRTSYNRALLRAAAELASPRLHVSTRELNDLPLYNEDVEAAGVPQSVADFRNAVRHADALLIATPEYNMACRAYSRTRSIGCRDRPATAR